MWPTFKMIGVTVPNATSLSSRFTLSPATAPVGRDTRKVVVTDSAAFILLSVRS